MDQVKAVKLELEDQVKVVLLLDVLVRHLLNRRCLLGVLDHLLLGQVVLLLLLRRQAEIALGQM